MEGKSPVLIARLGNTHGRVIERENSPEYLLEALNKGFDVLGQVYGDDHGRLFFKAGAGFRRFVCVTPEFDFNIKTIVDKFGRRIWLEALNVQALEALRGTSVTYFWRMTDSVATTSDGMILSFPSEPVTPITVIMDVDAKVLKPEQKGGYGICSDYVADIRDSL